MRSEIAKKVEVRLKVYTISPMDSSAKLITVTGSDIKPHPLFYRYGGVKESCFIRRNLIFLLTNNILGRLEIRYCPHQAERQSPDV
jgi:hypothetical protein